MGMAQPLIEVGKRRKALDPDDQTADAGILLPDSHLFAFAVAEPG